MKELDRNNIKAFFLSLSLACVLSACSLVSVPNMSDNDTLYVELGSEEGIAEIVDLFVDEIGFDGLVFEHFKNADVDRFRNKLIEHLCQVSDGPCEYTGGQIDQVHEGMNISEKEFNHTVDLLIAAMNKAGIKHTTQNKLLARLVPLRGDIIYQ